MKIYGLSGLGADERVFDYLKLDHEFVSIDWIEPLKNESIVDFSKRLLYVIDTSKKFCLLGVSFGGLIAVEISKILNPTLTFLISSIETKHDLPLFLRWIGNSNLTKLIPVQLFDPPRRITHYFFGTKQTKLLNNILDDVDLNFAKWAISELLNWQNESRSKSVIKINGTDDKLIPPIGNSKMKLIKGGSHFMIVDRAQEISDIINRSIKSLG